MESFRDDERERQAVHDMLLTCAVNLAVRAVKLAVLPRANCAGSAVRRLHADIIVCAAKVPNLHYKRFSRSPYPLMKEA